MKQRTDFLPEATVTFSDASTLDLTPANFTIRNNGYTDGAGANGLPLGVLIGRTISIELDNHDGRLSEYDFFGAAIALRLRFQLSASGERIAVGTFTVLTPQTGGETITVTATDASWRTDKTYTTSTTFPATLGTLLSDACDSCGIPYQSLTFKNSSFLVDAPPEGDYTFRQVIGYIACIAGGNARINRHGYMEIISYDFDHTAYHDLTDWINLTIDTSDITLTGLKTSKTTTNEDGKDVREDVLQGADGYVLAVTNPLILGKESEALGLMAANLVGKSFRKFSGDYIGYPIAEFMDSVKITDRRGNAYWSVITDIDFVISGMTTLSNSALSAVENAGTYPSAESKAVIAARKLVAQERTARETAIAQLNTLLAQSSGMYTTSVPQEDGSTIYYLHDKPTLAESKNVMKLTADAIGFSTDGGETYPFGLAVNGDTITRILSAVGVNAEWVKVGASSLPDSIDDLSSQLSVMLESFSSQFARQQETLDGIQTDMTAIQQNADKITLQVQKIVDDGVDKVTTTTGVTLDGDGLHIGKDGEEMESRIDYSGLHVERNGEAILEATASGVEAENVTVRTYLTIGLHARFEDYSNDRDSDRTACFFV